MALAQKKSEDGQDEIALFGALFEAIAAGSRDVEGVSRPAFSDIETKFARTFFGRVCPRAGAAVWFDEGRQCPVQPAGRPRGKTLRRRRFACRHRSFHGGNFDGMAGVLAGLACLVRARSAGQRFRATPFTCLPCAPRKAPGLDPAISGPRILTGTLEEKRNCSRRTRATEGRWPSTMADIGLPVERIERGGEPLGDLSAMAAYIEVHIEQGPLLIGKELPAARGGAASAAISATARCAASARPAIRAPCREPIGAIRCSPWPTSWCGSTRAGRRSSTRARTPPLRPPLTSGIVATDPQKHAMTRIPRFDPLQPRHPQPEPGDAGPDEPRSWRPEMRQVETRQEGALRARQADAGGARALRSETRRRADGGDGQDRPRALPHAERRAGQ